MKRKLSAILLSLVMILSVSCVSSIPEDWNGKSTETTAETSATSAVTTTPSQPKSEITPLLWRVTSPEGNSIYMFGSIHAATMDIYPLPNYITECFYNSEYLAVEADIVAFEKNSQAQIDVVYKFMYDDGRTIEDVLDLDVIDEMLDILGDSDGDYSVMARMYSQYKMFKPAMWSDAISGVTAEKAGLSYDDGLDRFFLEAAKKQGSGIEILEVESVEFQLEMMLSFSDELWQVVIEESLDMEKGVEGLLELYEAWKNGDEKALAEHREADFSEVAPEEFEYYQKLHDEYITAMLTNRDIGMAEVAKSYMADGLNVFYVVGAAHLVGENSVIDLLRRDGYTIELVSP
ncbi:MAG: TraB/GumN family protein [Oscillospiraceae bacterium]|nr:TraB/GumN family protein [Oscillospiraceae bacterium]